MSQDVQQFIDNIKGEFVKGGCRSLLTTMSQQLGGMPALRRLALDFEDRKKWPGRPMLTLRAANPSIYLLGWREGEFTQIHDHAGNEVGIYVLQGIITEDVYAMLKRPRVGKLREEPDEFDCPLAFSREFELGSIISCPVPYFHRMGNDYPELAITLHCYGPSLDAMRCFEEIEPAVFRHNSTWKNDGMQH